MQYAIKVAVYLIINSLKILLMLTTVLLFAQLSTAPLTPPQKPIKWPEKQPAMYACNVEITEEVRRRNKDKDDNKVITFTLLPNSDVVVLVHKSSTRLASAPTILAQPQSSGVAQAASHRDKLSKQSFSGSQTKFNRRGIRNW